MLRRQPWCTCGGRLRHRAARRRTRRIRRWDRRAPTSDPGPPKAGARRTRRTRQERPQPSRPVGARPRPNHGTSAGGVTGRSTGCARRWPTVESPAMSNVAILGYGRFGRALGRLFLDAGIPYRAFDSQVDVAPEHRASSPQDLVSGASFVILAMPVPRMYEALSDLRPHLSPNQIVFDVGSVKVVPEAALSSVLGEQIPWCGTHPLFGPVSLALAERPLRVVICPAKAHPNAAAKVRRLYEQIGCEVIEQTPESHDRVMAHTHALTFFVAKGMIDAGAGVDVQFAPPSFQALARTIETVRSDGGHLFAAIARDNPFAAEARKELVQALAAIDRTLDSQFGDEAPAAAMPISIPDLGERSPEL